MKEIERPEDRPFSSALLVKLISAARASHHDMPFSAWDADLLVAAGAFVNVIVLELRHIASEIREVSEKLIPQLKEFLILGISLGNVS